MTAINPMLEDAARLTGLAGALVDLLEEELMLIKKRDPQSHAALLQQKQAMVSEYYNLFRGLTREPQKLKALPSMTREQMRVAGGRLDEALKRNAEALNEARLATDYVMRVIVKAVSRQQQEQKPAYADPRAITNGRAQLASPISVRSSV